MFHSEQYRILAKDTEQAEFNENHQRQNQEKRIKKRMLILCILFFVLLVVVLILITLRYIKDEILSLLKYLLKLFSISLIEQLRFDVNNRLVVSQCPDGMTWEGLHGICIPIENFEVGFTKSLIWQ